MSSTERGRDVVRLLEPYTRIRGCSYLDVGTAYCGFLVAFQEAGAGTVRGIEYDPSFYEIGLANLKDCALSADVRLADITNAAATADLSQQIDVITCNDVIEHVQDTAALLRQIHRLLSPAGLAYFEIPNGWDASSVVSDAHYGLCGITILDYPEEATAYFLDCNPGGFHGTYWYLSREQYAEKFAAARLTVEWLPSYEDRNVEASLAELRGGARLETVPLRHRSRVREAIGRYLNEVDAARGNADFMVRYATPMWRALVRKA